MKEALQGMVRRLALAALGGEGLLRILAMETLKDLVVAEVLTQEEIEIEGGAAWRDANEATPLVKTKASGLVDASGRALRSTVGMRSGKTAAAAVEVAKAVANGETVVKVDPLPGVPGKNIVVTVKEES